MITIHLTLLDHDTIMSALHVYSVQCLELATAAQTIPDPDRAKRWFDRSTNANRLHHDMLAHEAAHRQARSRGTN
jgi:hypothetical protein